MTFSTVCVLFICFPPHCVSAGSMNSLPVRAALSLCRRTAGGLRLLAGSQCHPDGSPAAPVQPVRVCHSGTDPEGSVKTKKRGYDITRNPHLNKVSSLLSAVVSDTNHIYPVMVPGPYLSTSSNVYVQTYLYHKSFSFSWQYFPQTIHYTI